MAPTVCLAYILQACPTRLVGLLTGISEIAVLEGTVRRGPHCPLAPVLVTRRPIFALSRHRNGLDQGVHRDRTGLTTRLHLYFLHASSSPLSGLLYSNVGHGTIHWHPVDCQSDAYSVQATRP